VNTTDSSYWGDSVSINGIPPFAEYLVGKIDE
jgi:hypothetical protein